jgi:hypothetical protein
MRKEIFTRKDQLIDSCIYSLYFNGDPKVV